MQGPWVVPNPGLWAASDSMGRSISVTVPWDPDTRALGGATVVRDAGCELTSIYIGLGTDGTPNSTLTVLTVPEGSTTIPAGTFGPYGLHTIDDITALQITAGP